MNAIITKSKSTWLKLPLGELCEVNIGRTPARDRKDYWGPGHLWLSIADMNQGRNLETTKETITDLAVQECNCRLAPVGTVLLSFKLSIGKVGIASVPLFTNEAIASLPIRDNSKILTDYLYWALQSIDLTLGLDRAAKGLTLNKAKLLEVQIPLPPLEEQKLIAEVLDRAQSLISQRREAIGQLDTLTQAIFIEMFGDPITNPKGWTVTPLSNLVTEFRYGSSNKSKPFGKPALRIPNVVGGSLNLSDLKLVPVDNSEFDRLRMKNGDILFVRTNGNPDFVGRCAVFDYQLVANTGFPTDEFIFASYLIRARLTSELIVPIFLREFLLGTSGRRELRSRCKTSAGQFNINIEGLGAISIPIPPIPLQQEFADRTEAVEKLKAAHRASLSELDALFASLQHRAFRGEL